MKPLRFQAFGVGCAKTGTSSLARMFKKHYRSRHEAEARPLIGLILRRAQLSDSAFREAVRAMLEPLDLEMNSSQVNGYIIETMVELFPRAKFILTLREPGSWLRSFVNHQMTREKPPPGSPWALFRDLRFLPREALGDAEKPSDSGGRYTAEQYLAYWTAHNMAVINAVPKERLLIVRTEQLDREIPQLASFLGIDEATIIPARANEGDYKAAFQPVIGEQQLSEAVAHYAEWLR